ncbi:MAG TPA: TRAP transporter fused permease subunit [Bryobacterales bacterium]|nr:TRAP transporter fused permease subunit [Bryobacterales bacterium]
MSALLENISRYLTTALVWIGCAFALYTGATGPFQAPIQRGVFLLIMLPLVFLQSSSNWMRTKTAETALGLTLTLLTALAMSWTLFDYERLYSEPFISSFDTAVGAIALLLIVEAVRRTVGVAVAVVLLLFLAYAVGGPWVPGEMLRHGGLTVEDVVSIIFYGTFGVFGTPLGVCATFIVVIILFGSFLTATGGAEMFMNIGKVIAGRFVGGPAKIAVVSSGLMGMITGATVANVATTGAVTIPMMKRSGYDPTFAAAVEALASSGGQLMPPIMGAAAFVMIDYLNISYAELMLHATVPALLYFFSVLMIVHFRSVKDGVMPIRREEIPSLSGELAKRGNMLLPIAVLVVLLGLQFSVMYAAFVAVACAMAVSFVRPQTRLDAAGFDGAFRSAMHGMLVLTPICAGAGIIVGVMTATGLNLRITYLIENIAQGNLFPTLLLTMIACIVLGMGLPTVAAYVVLATLIPATLTSLGVPAIAAHLFLFYFAILSAITPPVCTGAYVAAGIAGTDPIRTGFRAMKLGLVTFLLPFAFIYGPALLLIGEWQEIVLHVGTCTLGIYLWAIALQGFFRSRVPTAARAALFTAGVMLIWPHLWVSVCGGVIGAATLFTLPRHGDGQPEPPRKTPVSP